MPKRGRLSRIEQKYILENAKKATPEQIAAKLGRTVEMVDAWMRANAKSVFSPEQVTERLVIRHELRNSKRWKKLKAELLSEELEYFEEEYTKYVEQFGGDVTATEESQIFDLVKYDILKSRNMMARKRACEDIIRLEHALEDHLAAFSSPDEMSDRDKSYAVSLEAQLNAARKDEKDRTDEYVKLQDRYDKLLKDLKGTRDQRIKEITDTKKDFVGVIKALAQREIAEREGRQLALMKMAGDKAHRDLAQLHTYEDGSVDSPILSADTLEMMEESEA